MNLRDSVLIALLFGIPAAAQTQPLACTEASGVAAVMRAGALTDFTADFRMACTGGTPTPAGQAVPTITITLGVKAATFEGQPAGFAKLTSNPTNASFSEALLIIDDPNSPVNPTRPLLNCGNSGAPDNGANGAGVCSIRSTGVPTQTYDGTPNGYGAGICNGTAGVPAANTFGCGRPNVFQGRYTSLSSNSPELQFSNIPFDPPGDNQIRMLDFTNLRVSAAGITLAQPFPTATVRVTPTITSLIPMNFALTSPYGDIVAVISNALASAPAEVAVTSPILVQENLESGLLPRNYSFNVGDNLGTPGNGSSTLTYNGNANYPADVAQNVPWAQYFSESGFQWQNLSPNGPKAPNPPFGFGSTPASLGGPLASLAFAGTNTRIDRSGVAQAGSRIAVNFTNIPPGAVVEVPPRIQLKSRSNPAITTGLLALTTTDANGAGPYTPRSGFLNAQDHMAVYEVLFAYVFMLEQAQIPFTLSNAPAGTQLKAVVQLAPFYSTPDAGRPNDSLPEPRFLDGTKLVPCLNLPCLDVQPSSAMNLGPAKVTISTAPLAPAPGLLQGASLKLVKNGMPDIESSGASNNADNSSVAAQFNLAGVPVGPRDVVITAPDGRVITLPDGFTVTGDPGCSYAVDPKQLATKFSGGRIEISVTTATGCRWAASSDASWMSLLPSKPDSLAVRVQPNTHGPARIGRLSVAGTVVTVQQERK